MNVKSRKFVNSLKKAESRLSKSSAQLCVSLRHLIAILDLFLSMSRHIFLFEWFSLISRRCAMARQAPALSRWERVNIVADGGDS
jgi:hypothetical protein